MKANACAKEDAALAAQRTGEWSDELRRHLTTCPVCSGAVLVAGALAAEARAAERECPLPDPGKIWLEARLRARRLQVARAARPVAMMRRVAAACAVAVALVVGFWLRPEVAPWLSWLRPPGGDVVSRLAFLNGVILLIASGGLLAAAAYALLAAIREP